MVQVNPEKTEKRSATTAEILDAWNNYAEMRKEMAAEHLLLGRPKVIENKKIILSLTNAVEVQLLNNLKTEIQTILRETCGDGEITVEHKLEVTETVRPAYTNKEKLDKLIEKYPLVQELKERFGLDPEF